MNIEVGNRRQKSWAETRAILRTTKSQGHFKRVSQRKMEVFGFLFPLVAGLDKVGEYQERQARSCVRG